MEGQPVSIKVKREVAVMEVERQGTVRLATWLCEAIEDTIDRFHRVKEDEIEMAEEDEVHASEEREKQADPTFYEEQAQRWRRYAEEDKKAIDRLLPILKSAQVLRDNITAFWQERKKIEKREGGGSDEPC
jgi:thymidylate synthase